MAVQDSIAPVGRVKQTSKEKLIWGVDFVRQVPATITIVTFEILRTRIGSGEEPVDVSSDGAKDGTIVAWRVDATDDGGDPPAALPAGEQYEYEVRVVLSNTEEKEANLIVTVVS